MNKLSKKRIIKEEIFKLIFLLSIVLSFSVLIMILYHILRQGLPWLTFEFLSNFPSRFPEKAGIKAAIFGSMWLLFLTTVFSVPIGVCTSIYLEEYSKKNKFITFLEIIISNLAATPSIIYGILGLVIFVRFMNLDRSLIAGSLTMSLLVLPIIIIASREAIRAVPNSIRLGAFALGATRWKVVTNHVLIYAMPGIFTGIILAVSRTIGETAPLIMIGALTYVAFIPESIMDPFTVLPIQIFNWAARPQEEFHNVAAAGIIVLLIVLICMNALVIYLRNKADKRIF